jgi:hypothetical protein
MSLAIQLRPSAMLFLYHKSADYERVHARTEKRPNCIRRSANDRLDGFFHEVFVIVCVN